MNVSGGAEKLRKVVNITMISTSIFGFIAVILVIVAAGGLDDNPSASDDDIMMICG